MRAGQVRAVIGVGALALLLTGCSAPLPAASPETHSSSPSEEVSPILDAEVGRTCAAQAIIQTNLANARSEFAAGLLTQEQYVAIVNTVSNDYQLMAIGPSWGLSDYVKKLASLTRDSADAPFGARFDPHGEYAAVSGDLATECIANGSPIAVYATQGG